ncbi:hypothetical protein CANARDRAFT_23600 [[Candida] arabinofermentans NRRL YB-2248]|uniref:Uncharacterized protein n=1 Tax=[Candida] arabinofermentans NRRL YB-2248 TaxID=983967 RepID=A0A1E4SZY2_9ASCO|nr:hypothetical protein CANARDRAFT_23600 [[Candida] arabinofermentans NRRL YB-2248]
MRLLNLAMLLLLTESANSATLVPSTTASMTSLSTYSYSYNEEKITDASLVINNLQKLTKFNSKHISTANIAFEIFALDVRNNNNSYSELLHTATETGMQSAASSFIKTYDSITSLVSSSNTKGDDLNTLISLEMELITLIPWVESYYQALAYKLDALSYSSKFHGKGNPDISMTDFFYLGSN